MSAKEKTFHPKLFDMMYVLVLWPEVQALMEYEWFEPECLLYVALPGQYPLESAYFIPFYRLYGIEDAE